MFKRVNLLKPRLVGKRYDDHALPLMILKDFSVFEEFVIDVAKWLYLQDNPSRMRAPKKFTDNIYLEITKIEKGSAQPIIDMHVHESSHDLVPALAEDYFMRARDSIISAIDAAANDENVIDHLPSHLLGYFDRFGRMLLDDERIEFSPENLDRKAPLNRSTRKKLIMLSKSDGLTDNISILGKVFGVDQINLTYDIQLTTGQKIMGRMSSFHVNDILHANNAYRDGGYVSIKGVGRFNRNDQLKEVIETDQITILTSTEVQVQLEELKNLRDFWLDGKGLAPCKSGLDWLISCFSNLYEDDLPQPYVYPTPEGGVQVEWSIGEQEISLEIDLKNHQGYWHYLDISSDSDYEERLDLDDEEKWAFVTSKLREAEGQEKNE
ncbi:hypothetical protein [Halomonas elongata]|uniref:hypothetical protein n=1 Tax=Halomonas elongata TaxID=2746 RepID=UPI0023B1ADEF|nr:hypothetical protein [Halomonas elongata]